MDPWLVRNYLPALNQYFPSAISFLTLEYLIGFYSQEKQEVINEINLLIKGTDYFSPVKEHNFSGAEFLQVIFGSKYPCHCNLLHSRGPCYSCLNTYTCPNPLFGKNKQNKILHKENNKRARI